MADPAPLTRKERRPLLMALSHDGVMSRTELREHGWDRNAIAREVRAERWKMHGSHTVALHTGSLSLRRCAGVRSSKWDRRLLGSTTSQLCSRRGPRGRIYLDIGWEDIGLFLEIDGASHQWGMAPSHDNLRANAVTLQGGTVLRFDVVGILTMGAAFLDQVCQAHAQLRAGRVA